MKQLSVLSIILSAACAQAAPPKSLAGLWVATEQSTAYWMRLSASSTDPVVLIEEVSGTLVAQSVGRRLNPPTTTQMVIGQYLPGTRVAALNLGEPGASRRYAIGTAPEDRTGHLELRVFRVRLGHGINYERSISFRYKGPLPAPEDPKAGRIARTDLTAHDHVVRTNGD